VAILTAALAERFMNDRRAEISSVALQARLDEIVARLDATDRR
jgi:hypothetical protein